MIETYEEQFTIVEGDDSPGTVEVIEYENRVIVGGITEDEELAIYMTGDKTPTGHIADLIATDPMFDFQEGDCYHLATELQDIDGVTGYASVVDSDTGDMVHVLAVFGETLVDSLGFWDESDVESFWDMKLDAEGISVHVEYNDLDGVELGDAERSQTYHKLKELCHLVEK